MQFCLMMRQIRFKQVITLASGPFKIFCKIHRKTPVPESTLLITWPATFFKKMARPRVFFSFVNVAKLFKNTYFVEHLRTAASVYS